MLNAFLIDLKFFRIGDRLVITQFFKEFSLHRCRPFLDDYTEAGLRFFTDAAEFEFKQGSLVTVKAGFILEGKGLKSRKSAR